MLFISLHKFSLLKVIGFPIFAHTPSSDWVGEPSPYWCLLEVSIRSYKVNPPFLKTPWVGVIIFTVMWPCDLVCGAY